MSPVGGQAAQPLEVHACPGRPPMGCAVGDWAFWLWGGVSLNTTRPGLTLAPGPGSHLPWASPGAPVSLALPPLPSRTQSHSACLHTSRRRTRRSRTSSSATLPNPLAASSPSSAPCWPLPHSPLSPPPLGGADEEQQPLQGDQGVALFRRERRGAAAHLPRGGGGWLRPQGRGDEQPGGPGAEPSTQQPGVAPGAARSPSRGGCSAGAGPHGGAGALASGEGEASEPRRPFPRRAASPRWEGRQPRMWSALAPAAQGVTLMKVPALVLLSSMSSTLEL